MNLVEKLLSIPFLIQLYAEKYYQDDLSKTMVELATDFNVPKINMYDFIIVGGGTAGCVLARRLSEENAFFKVLLLEAGGAPPPAVSVPYFDGAVAHDKTINKEFRSVKMKKAALVDSGIIRNHVGKMLGGSGSHNGMTHNRGNPKDYDNWAAITNDSSWSFSNVLQYFKMSENFIGQQYGSENTNDFYGKAGPITVETSVNSILPVWFEAGRELGYKVIDANGFQTEGFAPRNFAIHQGRRMSTFSEYIEQWETDPLNKGYLTVIRYANVSKVLLDSENRAYGVMYTRHGFPQMVHASKEIILSAGVFSSPLLLMKSGIGPENSLKEAGIPVAVPLGAVGKKLIDHPGIVLDLYYVNHTTLNFPRFYSNATEALFEDYHINKAGLLANVQQGAQCFIVSSKAEENWPNIWVEIIPEIMKNMKPQHIKHNIALGRPKSVGELKLNAKAYKEGIRDDAKLAIIDHKLLNHSDDMDAMVEGIKFVLHLSENTTAFKNIGMTLYSVYPEEACRAFIFRSDDYWKCYLSQETSSWNHMVGTCNMGADSDISKNSVVDPKFRVRGVGNLRVVDASVMPAIPNANINAAVIMIAEKASEEILKTWQDKAKVAI